VFVTNCHALLHVTNCRIIPGRNHICRCQLLGLEVLSDRRKIAAALFVRSILCRRIESVYLADLLRFESNPYPRRRNARLMDFYHRTNYGQNEPVNMFFVMASVALCLESGLINCDCNNILDVPAKAISIAVGVSFCELFL
jgi:hypothetical protein